MHRSPHGGIVLRSDDRPIAPRDKKERKSMFPSVGHGTATADGLPLVHGGDATPRTTLSAPRPRPLAARPAQHVGGSKRLSELGRAARSHTETAHRRETAVYSRARRARAPRIIALSRARFSRHERPTRLHTNDGRRGLADDILPVRERARPRRAGNGRAAGRAGTNVPRTFNSNRPPFGCSIDTSASPPSDSRRASGVCPRLCTPRILMHVLQFDAFHFV